MNQEQLERVAPLSGLGAVLLVALSAVLINQWTYLPSATDLQAFYTDNSGAIIAGGQVGLVAAAALMWFSGSLRVHLLKHDAGGRLVAMGFGGMLSAGALSAVGYSMVLAAGARGGADGGISAESAVAMYDLYATVIGSGVGVALGVALLATGVATLRYSGMATWLAWTAIVFGLGSLSPFAYIFIGLDMLWIAVVSIVLYRSGEAATIESAA